MNLVALMPSASPPGLTHLAPGIPKGSQVSCSQFFYWDITYITKEHGISGETKLLQSYIPFR